jgi:ELWxxDGT repeat protein
MRTLFLTVCLGVALACSSAIQPAQGAVRAHLLEDLNPGPEASLPAEFTSFSSALYFSAATTATGRELWQWNGEAVVLAANINDTLASPAAGNSSSPKWLTLFEGQLYFSAFEPRRGGELWRFDGARAARVADISPDASDTIKAQPNSSWPQELTVFNGALYFSANSGALRDNYELWSYNGSTARQVANLRQDSGTLHSSYPKGLTVFGNALYFMADDGTNGAELWKHTAAGETVLMNINPGGATSSSYPKYFTHWNGFLYFQAFHPERGYELWRTDGTNVSLVADLRPGTSSSFPEYMTAFQNQLYFRATDGVNGSELFRFDGNSITLAADIRPGGDSYPKGLTVLSDLLFFAADDGVHGWELWQFDGTTASLVKDLNPDGDAFPEQLVVLGDLLYFVATTPETGYELWSYDGRQVRLVADLHPGSEGSYPKELSVRGGKVYFSAAADGNNWEPWTLVSDATAATAVLAISPAGSTLVAPAEVRLSVTAENTSEPLRRVAFFSGTQSLGVVESAPFELTVKGLEAGVYSLTIVIDLGADRQITSAPQTLRVAAVPSLMPMLEPNGSILLEVQGTAGMPHTLQSSEDLVHWNDVFTQTATGAPLQFHEPSALPARFYRVIIR